MGADVPALGMGEALAFDSAAFELGMLVQGVQHVQPLCSCYSTLAFSAGIRWSPRALCAQQIHKSVQRCAYVLAQAFNWICFMALD